MSGIYLGVPGIPFNVAKQFISGSPQAVTTFHKLIQPLIAATNREEHGGVDGQPPRVEGAGEHQVRATAAAEWKGPGGHRGEVTSSRGIM